MSWKLSYPVLRGGESGDARTLPDPFGRKSNGSELYYNFLYALISINSQPLQFWEVISCATSSDTANFKGTPKISLIKKICAYFHRSDQQLIYVFLT